MTIAFVGHGYVGLVTASIFADLGNTVWVVGRDPQKIEQLKSGKPLFYEPGLEEIVKRNVSAGRLKFTLSYQEAVVPSAIIFICVGTPSGKTGDADLTEVFNAATQIATHISGYKIIAVKSTVPPGTNTQVRSIIEANKPPSATFDMASVPEFLRQGSAISDTLHPDRVVIGSDSKKARDALKDLHKPIDGKIVESTIETAELIKYASNAMLAVKISYANAIAIICSKVGADSEAVLEGVGLDKRIGRNFLYPGIGYGGSCFPKDVKALIAIGKNAGYDFALLKAVEQINVDARTFFIDTVLRHFQGSIQGKRLAVLGLSFKPNTDDMREAPAIPIISHLISKGANIVAFDPIAISKAKRVLPKETLYADSVFEAANQADAVLVLTEWNEFRQLDLVKLATYLKKPVLFDGRNIYDPHTVTQLGFIYYGIGRNPSCESV